MDRVRSSGFPTTAWTVVSRARGRADSEAREALAVLCAAYWLPLFSFARRLGNSSDDALDLTQAYFAVLIEKDYLADVRLREGRFRAFLLTSFRHFVSKERERARALKRGGSLLVSFLEFRSVAWTRLRVPQFRAGKESRVPGRAAGRSIRRRRWSGFLADLYQFPRSSDGQVVFKTFLDGGIHNSPGYGWGVSAWTVVQGFEALRATCLFFGVCQPQRLRNEPHRRPLAALLDDLSKYPSNTTILGALGAFSCPWRHEDSKK